jgi:hypothetical protein
MMGVWSEVVLMPDKQVVDVMVMKVGSHEGMGWRGEASLSY